MGKVVKKVKVTLKKKQPKPAPKPAPKKPVAPKPKKPAAPKCNLSKNGRCGPKYGNTICPAGYCSKWWWCGTSKLHKSTQQPKYNARSGCKKVAAKAPKPI